MILDFRLQSLFIPSRRSPGEKPPEESPQWLHFRSSALTSKNRPMIGRRLLPASSLGLQLFAPAARQPVETCLAVILGCPQSDAIEPSCSSFSKTGYSVP